MPDRNELLKASSFWSLICQWLDWARNCHWQHNAPTSAKARWMSQIQSLRTVALSTWRSLSPNAAKGGYDEGFSTRVLACGIGWVCVWPALTNLSGRKPRVLGAAYGERALSAGSVTATDALVWMMKAAASTFRRRIWPGFDPKRIRDAPFARLLRSLRTRWLGRFGRSNR